MKTKLSTIALAALLFAGLPLASSSAHVGISIAIAPPAIPIYEQPYAPGLGYIWTPGYWDYADFGYYWVPGVWVRPPRVGLYWTPGYWGYNNGLYGFNDGYWGSSVGFYGGINYGYGYGGRGYYGGRWSNGNFLYNTAVTRVNRTVINNNYTYVNKNVKPVGSRAGFNGPGGAKLKPSAQEQAVAKANRIPPTQAQRSRVQAAKNDPALRVKNNKGKPKAEAVQALNRKTGANTAAETAANGNEKQRRAAEQNGNKRAAAADQNNAENNQTRAHANKEKAANRSEGGNHNQAARRATAAQQDKAARAERHARPAARSVNRPVEHAQRQAPAHRAPQMAHHAQAMPQRGRPQMAQHRGPAPRSSANAPQQAKKKKHPKGPGQ